MPRKSVKREYELDRSYDYVESCGFSNAKQTVGFVKRRARRRLRHDNKSFINRYADMVELEDTLDLSSSGSNTVRVRLSLSAPVEFDISEYIRNNYHYLLWREG